MSFCRLYFWMSCGYGYVNGYNSYNTNATYSTSTTYKITRLQHCALITIL